MKLATIAPPRMPDESFPPQQRRAHVRRPERFFGSRFSRGERSFASDRGDGGDPRGERVSSGVPLRRDVYTVLTRLYHALNLPSRRINPGLGKIHVRACVLTGGW